MRGMPTELYVVVTGNPGRGFMCAIPESPEFDLRVSFDVLGTGRIRARMSGTAVPTLNTGEHRVDLHVTVQRVQEEVMALRRLWKTMFVDYQPVDGGRPVPGRYQPCATKADLSSEPEKELLRLIEQLADRGAYLLFDVLLAGDGIPLQHFRETLASILAREHLRVRFDSSDLFLPWPMLCLKPSHLPTAAGQQADGLLADVYSRFLGYRHQIEHAGEAYPDVRPLACAADKPSASLNHNHVIGSQLSAVAEVAEYLRTHTRYTVRESYWQLLDFFKTPVPDEQLMYFWCHGKLGSDVEGAHLVFELSDGQPFDGSTLDAARADLGEADRISPFVLFNACYASLAGPDADSTFMSRVLIHHGAQGVLGPQIEMPQVFAAEYALQFLQRYVPGGTEATAGRLTLELARLFADEYRSPLGIAYALHSGMSAYIPVPAAALPDSVGGDEVNDAES